MKIGVMIFPTDKSIQPIQLLAQFDFDVRPLRTDLGRGIPQRISFFGDHSVAIARLDLDSEFPLFIGLQE